MTDIQRISLELLKVVIDICERHDIEYYAFGGTCLGAVRHKGFIPWDDDIDLAMPRSHYRRFIEIAKKELPEHIGFLESSKTEHYSSEMLKIYDARTTFIERVNINFPDRYCGVGLDIMPLDGVPAGKLRRALRHKKLRSLAWDNYVFRYHLRCYGIKGRLRMLKVNLMRPFTTWQKVYKRYIDKATEYDFNESELVAHSGPGVLDTQGTYKYYLDRHCFSEWIMMDFEDIQIRVPKDYDTYLRKYYPGRDYMELPPESEQIVHSTAIIDLKYPYTEFIEKYRRGVLKI